MLHAFFENPDDSEMIIEYDIPQSSLVALQTEDSIINEVTRSQSSQLPMTTSSTVQVISQSILPISEEETSAMDVEIQTQGHAFQMTLPLSSQISIPVIPPPSFFNQIEEATPNIVIRSQDSDPQIIVAFPSQLTAPPPPLFLERSEAIKRYKGWPNDPSHHQRMLIFIDVKDQREI